MLERRTKSRFPSRPVVGNAKRNVVLGYGHEAVEKARTLFPTTVINDVRTTRVLKSGVNSRKIGGFILKGKWKGFPVYTLTLEERATCPRDCVLWRICYGNKMQYAQRIAHGADLEWRLEREVATLAWRHPGGFAIRLHNLGDFYSVEYVALWRRLLDQHPQLHAWGYSARWALADPIARALAELVAERWDRFAIRFSGAPTQTGSTVTIRKVDRKPADAVVCPEQLGRTESCATCALCWQTQRRVAFLQH